jgi:hypothetical protein
VSEYTITYNSDVKGFPTFYSFVPDWMHGMNNYLYSFKGGNLYRHNTGTIGQYYGVNYPCTITSVLNTSPTEPKVFKTLSLESDDRWSVTLVSDMQTGIIDKTWFEDKEGGWFAFIRANTSPANFKMRSANGIGNVVTVVNTGGTLYQLDFNYEVGSIISIGDAIYFNSSPQPLLVGSVTNVAGDVVTVNATAGPVPSAGNFIFYVKNQQAESHGVLGYFCEFTLTNDSTSPVELFHVESSVFKSYP